MGCQNLVLVPKTINHRSKKQCMEHSVCLLYDSRWSSFLWFSCPFRWHFQSFQTCWTHWLTTWWWHFNECVVHSSPISIFLLTTNVAQSVASNIHWNNIDFQSAFLLYSPYKRYLDAFRQRRLNVCPLKDLFNWDIKGFSNFTQKATSPTYRPPQ